MAENHFTSTIESLFKGMDQFVTTKTVVGEPVQVGETIIIPLIDVTCGMAAGAFAQVLFLVLLLVLYWTFSQRFSLVLLLTVSVFLALPYVQSLFAPLTPPLAVLSFAVLSLTFLPLFPSLFPLYPCFWLPLLSYFLLEALSVLLPPCSKVSATAPAAMPEALSLFHKNRLRRSPKAARILSPGPIFLLSTIR
jgi:hypothetical protein